MCVCVCVCAVRCLCVGELRAVCVVCVSELCAVRVLFCTARVKEPAALAPQPGDIAAAFAAASATAAGPT